MFKKAKIKKVTVNETARIGKRIYNIAVEDNESYIVEGLVSHNCRCDDITYAEEDEQLIQDTLDSDTSDEEADSE